jgi:mannose-6-phosphate isomerase-like protein (cupin superfamily)
MVSDKPPEKALGERYRVGDMDIRPWGSYTVTAVGVKESGEESCIKEIQINPGHILSLQSHEHRREHWKVLSGVLTVVLDGVRHKLAEGQDIRIPVRGIHCMANLDTKPCIVQEVQKGMCREDDIRRYVDAYGRDTEETDDVRVAASVLVYRALLAELKKKAK